MKANAYMTRRVSHWAPIAVAVAAWLLWRSPAQAQDQESIDAFEQTKIRLNFEPAVSECMEASLKYFRVDYKNFDRLRSAAKNRGLLPTIAAGYRIDNTRGDSTSVQAPTNVTVINGNQTGSVNTFSVGGVWDLREVLFNPAEVQVYGLIGVQRGLMLELTRIYYLRKQLFVRFVNSPPKDPLAREALALRVDEFTALLDVLTGGWFTRTTDQRMQMRTGRKGRRGDPNNAPPPQSMAPEVIAPESPEQSPNRRGPRPTGPRPAMRGWQGTVQAPW